MKAIVTINGTHFLIDHDIVPSAAAFFAGAVECDHNYRDGTYAAKERPTVEVKFINDEQLGEKPEPFKALQAELETANRRWLESYTKANTAEKRVKELEAKLETIKENTNAES